MPYQTIELNGFDKVFEVLRLSNRAYLPQHFDNKWFFRGHADTSWHLKPRVWRDDFLPMIKKLNAILGYVGGLVIDSRLEHVFGLKQFHTDAEVERAKEMTVRLFAERHLIENFYIMADDVALLPNGLEHTMADIFGSVGILFRPPNPHVCALPQHHGIPTRLLDWTRDPLTALAFALDGCSDNADVDVWALNAGKIEIESEGSDLSKHHPITISAGDSVSNRYLYAQRGAFTFIRDAEKEFISTGIYPCIDDKTEDKQLTRFIVSLDADEKHEAMITLMRERKTKAHFMPDLSNCASYAIQALKLNTRLGS